MSTSIIALDIDPPLTARVGYTARPKGQLGNCGFHPFPWTIAYGTCPEQARENFIRDHRHQILLAKLRGKV